MTVEFHLPHMEDLILMGQGPELYERLLPEMGGFDSIQMKLDGAPSIVIGRDDNGLFVGNKTGATNPNYRLYASRIPTLMNPSKLSPNVTLICNLILQRLCSVRLPVIISNLLDTGAILNGDVMSLTLPANRISKTNVVEYDFRVGHTNDIVIGLHSMLVGTQIVPIQLPVMATELSGLTMFTNHLNVHSEVLKLIKSEFDANYQMAVSKLNVTTVGLADVTKQALIAVPTALVKQQLYEAALSNQLDLTDFLISNAHEQLDQRIIKLVQQRAINRLEEQKIEISSDVNKHRSTIDLLFKHWKFVSVMKTNILSQLVKHHDKLNLFVVPQNTDNLLGEGLVLTDRYGSVKLVDRLGFSEMNFRAHGDMLTEG